MNREEFYNQLAEGDLEVTFTKRTNGSIRVMKCTANAPKSDNAEYKKMTRPETLITVYDTEARGWRSFYSDDIITVSPIDTNFGLLQE